jgi:hypothetical protein
MQIYYLQRFWFWNVYNGSSTPQHHLYTINFDSPITVKGQIFLNILSPGASFDSQTVGLAAACVKMYTYLDDNGQEQTMDYTGQDPFGSISAAQVTSVTWELIVTLAWAGAHGMFYYID